MSASEYLLPQRFATSRLAARELRERDAPAVFTAYTQDDYSPRFVRWPVHRHLSETQAFVAKSLSAVRQGQLFAYVLTLNGADGGPIGMLEARPRNTMLDLGYVLARTHWGQGLMPEAVRAFTDLALAQRNIWRVQAVCDTENRGSVRSLEKAGFALEGRLDRFVTYAELSPEPRACFMFARCK